MSSPFFSLHFFKLLKFLSTVLGVPVAIESELPSGFRPSPLLVPLPIHFTAAAVVVDCVNVKEEHTLLSKNSDDKVRKFDGDDICTVCLSCIKKDDIIREIIRCCHVFHRDCLDSWIDIGKVTCPLCRCDLTPTTDHDFDLKLATGEGDPWRRERMIYLFGDDITF